MHQTDGQTRRASERLLPAPPSRQVAGQRTSAIGHRPELLMKDAGIRAVLCALSWSEPQQDFSHPHTTNTFLMPSLPRLVRRSEASKSRAFVHFTTSKVVPMSSIALARIWFGKRRILGGVTCKEENPRPVSKLLLKV